MVLTVVGKMHHWSMDADYRNTEHNTIAMAFDYGDPRVRDAERCKLNPHIVRMLNEALNMINPHYQDLQQFGAMEPVANLRIVYNE